MPVWKTKPDLLSLCMKSILTQTYTDFEFLIIYQKSFEEVDNQIEQIFNENSDDHRLKIIETKMPGFTNSLNLGLLHSKGEYVARMDGDDISEITRFEEQLNHLKQTKTDLVGSWAYSIAENGNVLGRIETPVSHSDIRKKIMFHNPFLHSSILLRKNIFEKIGKYNPIFEGAEDYDLYFRIIAGNHKVSNIPKYLIKLRETKGSIMRRSGWQKRRLTYLNVKKNAVKNLGFNSFLDRFYYSLTPLTLLLSPKFAFVLKNKIGYHKK